MKDELTPEQIKAILLAFDEAITEGPWDESNFLRAIGKNLREIRDNFAGKITTAEQNRIETTLLQRARMEGDQQEIFISLYSSDGSNIQAWERIISNLPRYMISRPIYSKESDIQYLIKSKENKVNEAYVGIYVKNDDILLMAKEKIAFDKFEKPLLSLKDRSLNLEKITRFVHLSGTYTYQKGRLIKNLVES